ncbi:DUF4097 domain-containing protein [Halalkalibacter urbisdiaboli]|uniref:DUF4097 domain-containing protein n=1 Tax=Halalkalibacter urbisdiaboli TaxID=1960589 RepID=UPI0013FDB77D|nr:DUF4097 domain-containing protein [Halalkalibacter urbisdiaboli]
MKKVIGFFFVILGVLLIVSTTPTFFSNEKEAAGQQEVAEEMKGLETITLSSGSSDWVIETYEGNEVTAFIDDNKKSLQFKRSGSHLSIDVKEKRLNWLSFQLFSKGTSVTLKIPKEYEQKLELKTISGDVLLNENLHIQELVLKTVSGDIKSQLLTVSELNIVTTSGDLITEEVISEQTTLKTVSGDIKVSSMVGELDANTVSGDMFIEFAHENEEVTLNTTSGDILMVIPNGNATLTLNTTSGDFLVEPALSEQSNQKRELSGKIGEGKYKVNVKSISGDIIIRGA